jgi:hypothetical protein
MLDGDEELRDEKYFNDCYASAIAICWGDSLKITKVRLIQGENSHKKNFIRSALR